MSPKQQRKATAFGLIIVVSGMGGLFVACDSVWLDPSQSAVRPLVRAVGKRRLLEARLTGGFEFGPLVTSSRSPQAIQDWRLIAAAADVRDRAAGDVSVDNRRALGVAFLLTGDATNAIRQLQDLEATAADPVTLADLSAAYLTRAVMAGTSEDLTRALEVSSRARELAPSLPEASFNRALALQQLNLVDQESHEWAAFLRIEPGDSGWAAIGRERLASLREKTTEAPDWHVDMAKALDGSDAALLDQLVRRSPEGARQFLETELLALALDNQPSLEKAKRAAASLERVSGDRLFARAIRELEMSPPAALSLGIRDYGYARRSYDNADWLLARKRLDAALPRLRTYRSPLVGPASATLAAIEYQAGRLAEARRYATVAMEAAQRHGGVLTVGRATFLLGLIEFTQGDFAPAIASYERAAAEFERAGEQGWSAFSREQIAEVWSDLGRREWGWAERIRVMRLLDRFTDPLRRITLVSVVGDACLDAGWPRAAVAFQEEAVKLAGDSGSQGQLAASLVALGRASGRDSPRRGMLHFASAKRLIASVQDPLLRQRLEGEQRRAFAEIMPVDTPENRSLAEEAIEWLTRRGDVSRAMQLRIRCARTDQAMGAASAAEQGFKAVVSALSRLRAPDQELAASYAEFAITALDGLLEVRAERPPIEALLLAEARWRAAQGESLAANGEATAALIDRIAPDASVLGIVPAPSSVVLFALTSGRITVRRVALPRTMLERTLSDATALVRGGHPIPAPAANKVFEALWDPVAAELVGRERVYVVSAGPVAQLPLRYLLSQRLGPRAPALFFVPSLSALSRIFPQRGRAPRASLFAFSSSGRLSGLPALPQAMLEAQTIVDSFGGGTALFDPPDAVFSFVRGLRTARLVHFAGHALPNPQYPARGALVLGDGLLSVREIRSMNLNGLELVSLAACSSARSWASFGEGTLTVANSFLAAGASAVVGTQWDVEDRVSPTLLRLYADLGHGVPLLDALRSLGSDAMASNSQDDRGLVIYTALGALSSPSRVEEPMKGAMR